MSNMEKIVGWAMILLALVFAAVLLAPDAMADEFKWERAPGAQPCAPRDIVWRQVQWPLPSGQAAEVDFATCTVISGYSVEQAKQVRAAGPLSDDPTSVYEHELHHLLLALRHPPGQTQAGWGRVFAPPALDVRLRP